LDQDGLPRVTEGCGVRTILTTIDRRGKSVTPFLNLGIDKQYGESG
jgi:hypothetical protein